MASIKDVAARAGVSTATVSRALSGNGHVSEKSRQQVLAAAEALGFVMSYSASSLASGRHRNVGVVVPTVARWYYSEVIEGASNALLEAGYDFTLYNTGSIPTYQQSVLKDFLLRQRLDAVIVVSMELDADEIAQLLLVKRPVVGIGGPLPGVPSVGINGFDLASLATEHLLALGHTRIAHISGTQQQEVRDFRVTGTRREGYEDAMRRAGLTVPSGYICDGDFTIPGGYRQAKQLLSNPRARPTAFFCASDEMAIGAILAARDLGLQVPGDVSVIGIDGHELGELFGLTTIEQHPRRQGERAVQLLLQALKSQDPTFHGENELVSTNLRVRSSTAVPQSGSALASGYPSPGSTGRSSSE